MCQITLSEWLETVQCTHRCVLCCVIACCVVKVMIVSRAKTPNDSSSRDKRKENDKWRLENTSEASVLGNHFAQVIMMVASGNADQVLHKKKVIQPCKKVFWEEVRFNPALENTNDVYAHNAHHIEESSHWKRGGKRFVGGPRFATEPSNGPILPAEYAHLYEKPTVMFERSGQLRPFSRARKFNKPHEHCTPNAERVRIMCISYNPNYD